MSKILLIGDPHGQPNNLKDLGAIFDLAEKLIRTQTVDYTVLMGDLFHTHRIVSQEVIDFYKKNLPRLKGFSQIRPEVLIGNHDMVGPTNDSLNAVSLTLEGYCNPVVTARQVAPNVWGIPFISDNARFVEICNQVVPKDVILLCHQTFDGSRYENGFYAPNGVDQKLIPQSIVISGHIHSKQNIGKVTYVGTPRAVTAGEANQSKYIWLYDTEANKLAPYSTDSIVKTYRTLEVNEDSALILDHLNFVKDDIRIVVSGTQEFYNSFIERHSDLIGKAKIIPNIKQITGKKIELEQSGSMKDALQKYVFEVSDINPELKEGVWKKLQEVIPSMSNKSGF